MKKRTNIINFVLSIDQKYIQQTTVTITSILVNLNRNYKAVFYIFIDDYKNKPNEFLVLESQFKCKIVCINCNKYHKYFVNQNVNFSGTPWISKAAYNRLLMFKFLPSTVSTAIYCDSDTIIEEDLTKEYKKFIKNDCFFAAVADIFFLKKWRKEKKIYKKYEEFNNLVKSPLNKPYFCDAFYIANIQRAKKEKVFEQFLHFLAKHPTPFLADQDTMNAVFSQKYHQFMTYLHPKYQVPMDAIPQQYRKKRKYYYDNSEIFDAFQQPAVRHYSGCNKPWDNKCRTNNDRWWYYHDLSPANMKKPTK